MFDRRTLLAAAAASSMLAGVRSPARAALAAAPDSEGARLTAIYERIYDMLLDQDPEFATSLGADKGDRAAAKAKLADRSPAGIKQGHNRLPHRSQGIEDDRSRQIVGHGPRQLRNLPRPVGGLCQGLRHLQLRTSQLARTASGNAAQRHVSLDPRLPRQSARDCQRRRCRGLSLALRRFRRPARQ
jgi:uncharacterized protein (DUF885 family)